MHPHHDHASAKRESRAINWIAVWQIACLTGMGIAGLGALGAVDELGKLSGQMKSHSRASSLPQQSSARPTDLTVIPSRKHEDVRIAFAGASEKARFEMVKSGLVEVFCAEQDPRAPSERKRVELATVEQYSTWMKGNCALYHQGGSVPLVATSLDHKH